MHEPAHALDRLGDQRGHVARGHRGQHLAQVVDRRLDLVGVGQPGHPAAEPVAGGSQDTWTGLSELDDQLRCPVIAMVANVRPW